MFIAREPKQDRRKPQRGGMVGRDSGNVAPMELGLGGLYPQRQSSAVLSIEAISTPHDSVLP